MQIEKLTNKLENQYNIFLNTQKLCSIYYSLKYRDLIAKETASDPHYLVAREKDKITGILPLMIKDGPLGKVINSLPYYGSHGGILTEDQNIASSFLRYYSQLLSSDGYASGVIIENPLIKNINYDKVKVNETDQRISQITDISGNYRNEEDLLLQFHSKTRNSIRKAKKSNVNITIDNNAWDFLYSTHLENMNKLDGLSKTNSFFNLLKNSLNKGEDYNIYIAKLNDEIVAALLVLYYGRIVEYFTPVIKSDFRDFQPMSLIISTAMMTSSIEGYKLWNWGGTWLDQDGVHRFKSRWGTNNVFYKYYITINNNDIYNSSKEFLQKHYSGFYVIPFKKLKKI